MLQIKNTENLEEKLTRNTCKNFANKIIQMTRKQQQTNKSLVTSKNLKSNQMRSVIHT